MLDYLLLHIPRDKAEQLLPFLDSPQQARIFCEHYKHYPSALDHFPMNELVKFPELWLVSSAQSHTIAEWLQEVYPKHIENTVDITDSILQCHKCHKNTVDYYEKQTRGADEPMTLFANCLSCGYRWRQ
tara:strand:- start:131 stop:517 length:387 start_codon:yes stop_codon:yes gene_type:complete